jgi:Mrp family chromosome partitioning ATPase
MMTKSRSDNPAMIYQSLLYGIFQRPRADPHIGVSLAITSANPGEGVTHTTKGLANALEMSKQQVALVDFSFLQRKSEALEEVIHTVDLTGESHIRELYSEAPPNGSNGSNGSKSQWHRSLEYRKSCVRRLCSHFDVVLIDCPSLRRSGEVLSIAAAVDGVILVVQAGKTTKADLAFAERQITASGGRLEGHILNRQSTPFSRWFHKR